MIEGTPHTGHTKFVVGGMGGSALPGYALKFLGVPHVLVHESYDAPTDLSPDTLAIAISYSGNTEETLSFACAAEERGLPLACVTSGGALADVARNVGAPLALVPGGMSPRDAFPDLLKATLMQMGNDDLLTRINEAGESGQNGDTLVHMIGADTPVIHATTETECIARLFQVYLTEAAKIPAFVSIVPSSNHYELQSLDPKGPHAARAKEFVSLFITNTEGDSRLEHRLAVLEAFVGELGYRTENYALVGSTRADMLMAAWAFAREGAEAFAAAHGVDPDTQPLTEEFKKRL